ncbi:MAG TPA: HNH endonuclease, partial [Blastocatellia bacterium]|nr:HNH endonuclease [Blastocatellia bacterium]
RQWRKWSENATLLDIQAPARVKESQAVTDIDLIRFYAQCFDRPAFQDHFHQEGSMEAFDRAIEDTITAVNTGCLRARDGGVLAASKGKSYLENPEWRERMDLIVDLLRAIRSRYDDAKKRGAIYVSEPRDGSSFYAIHDHEVAEWMDRTRAQIFDIFGEICQEAGVIPLAFPRSRGRFR